jgi:N-acetyl-anhydromuramyl-L-alanine amidase AmpD
MRYPLATWAPSPNYTRGRGGTVVDLITIHHTDGQARADRAVAHLRNAEAEKRVSAHFLVGQEGEVFQLVDTADTAWHCSGWNARSVGVEHVARTPGEHGRGDLGFPLTAAQLRASAKLVGWLLHELRLPVEAVVPHCSSPTTTHHDCGRDQADGGIWPWEEYVGMVAEALLALS